jgi:hypothetical protein
MDKKVQISKKFLIDYLFLDSKYVPLDDLSSNKSNYKQSHQTIQTKYKRVKHVFNIHVVDIKVANE